MKFTNHTQTHLDLATIDTATDTNGKVWTLVATAAAEDIVITPSGRHVDASPAVVGLSGTVEKFLRFVADQY